MKLKCNVVTVVLCVCALFGYVAQADAQSYENLWKQVREYEKKDLPKSAYKTVRQIDAKAEKEKADGQRMAALLYGCVLRQQIVPDSFYTDMQMLERRKKEARDKAEQAVYASVLGEVYKANAHRGRTNGLTTAHPDSIREWSYEQYMKASTANFVLSMAYPAQLADVRAANYVPFVVQGRDASAFQGDLLNVIGRRAVEGVTDAEVRSRLCAEMLDVYRRKGNRQAELLVMLDSVGMVRSEGGIRPLNRKMVVSEEGEMTDEQVLSSPACRTYLDMLTRFADLPMAAEIYIRLIDLPVSAERQVKWAEEGVRKYPSYPRVAVLKNRIRQLQVPYLRLSLPRSCYPGITRVCRVERRNLCGAELRWYRMPASMTEEEIRRQDGLGMLKATALRSGKLIRTQRLSWDKAEPWAAVEDSVTLEAPETGAYVVVMRPDGVPSAKDEIVGYTLVGRLELFAQALPDNRVEVCVVDAVTGTPVQDATVKVMRDDKTETTVQTDPTGRAVVVLQPDDRYGMHSVSFSAVKGEDRYMQARNFYGGYNYEERERCEDMERLYTDRALYRPGQTVFVGGLCFSRQGKTERVAAGRAVQLALYDANGKKVAERGLTSDEMGRISTDFVLPVTGLNGYYTVRSERGSASFKVEEYKRPTFEITLQPVTEVFHIGDTVALRGEVTNFTGVPVRRARVTAVSSLARYFRMQGDKADEIPLDTVYTDENGHFVLYVPVREYDSSRYIYGVNQTVSVAATNGAGETHEATAYLPLSRSGLRVDFSAPEHWDKAAWPRMTLNLSTMAGGTLTDSATVRYDLLRHAVGAPADTIRKDRVWIMRGEGCPEDFKSLPDGSYELKFRAVADGDTAVQNHRFVVFDHHGVRPVPGQKDWFHIVRDSITADAPAHVQVGSDARDVTLYYTLFCKDKVLQDTLYTFTDSVLGFRVPYSEELGDGVLARFVFVKDCEVYSHETLLTVPCPDRKLSFKWTSFRDRLTPGVEETWKLRVLNPDGTPASAGLMATLYDASLDRLVPHHWYLDTYIPMYYPSSPTCRSERWNRRFTMGYSACWNSLTWRNLVFDTFDRSMMPGGYMVFAESNMLYSVAASAGVRSLATVKSAQNRMMKEEAAADMDADVTMSAEMEEDGAEAPGAAPSEAGDFNTVQLRENLNETAFFYPCLTPDSTGEFTLTFTLPESLTSWRFMALAHTKDMMSGIFTDKAVAVKEVMACLDLPRFVRAGDKATLSTSLFNLTEGALKGRVTMEVFDPATGKSLWKESRKLTLDAASDTVVSFGYAPVNAEVSLPACRVMFEAAGHTDGEQRYLPILDDTEWLTQTLPFTVRGKGTTEIKADVLFQHNHSRATGRKLTVEYAAGPLWYAVQALPSVLEPRDRDALSLGSALYASLLSSRLVAQYPKMKTTVDAWMRTAPESLKSPLAGQEELKGILLDETPWLTDAEAETRRMQSLQQLFDTNRQADLQRGFCEALGRLQNADGGFGWMNGMRSSEYMTMGVAQLFGRAGLLNGGQMPAVLKKHVDLDKMVRYLTDELHRMVKDDRKYMREQKTHLYSGSSWLPYLYMAANCRSSWFGASAQADLDYAMNLLLKDKHELDLRDKAHAAVVLHRKGHRKDAAELMQSLEEHLVETSAGLAPEYPSKGFRSSQYKIDTQVAMMEAFAACQTGADSVLNGMSRWLLGQKRVQSWNTVVNSMNAVYALVDLRHDELNLHSDDELRLLSPSGDELVRMRSSEGELAGLGYVSATVEGKELKRGTGVIAVNKEDGSAEAWGAAYAQFRLPLADVASQAEGVSIRCEVSDERPKAGDRVVLRYVITADKDYEYVCLKAGRAACLEPVNALSGYEYRDGLGYYKEVRDASTRYFFERLPKGTYVLETEYYVERAGTYAVGTAELSGVYAPEFSAYAPAPVLNVKP